MKLYTITFFLLFVMTSSYAFETERWDSIQRMDSTKVDSTETVVKKRPWRAAALTMTTQLLDKFRLCIGW